MNENTKTIDYNGHQLQKSEAKSLQEIEARINEKVKFKAEDNHVIELDLERTNIADLGPLRSFQALRSLDLKVTSVSDLTPLQSLDNLQNLNISKTDVSDITPLTNLSSLQKLTIGLTPVHDFDCLKHLTNLRLLNLFHVDLSDLSPLTQLTELRKLFLSYNPISDLQPLRSLVHLRTLDLAGTSVSDLTPLKNLPQLQKLSLYDTPVANIAPLKHIPSLKELDVRNTKLSHRNEVGQSLQDRGVNVKGLSRCYITTAVCQYSNLSDTDDILESFRTWRDTHMKSNATRRALVRKYYRQAPKLVKKIREQDIEADIYPKLLHRFILPALRSIKQGKDDLALQIYKQALEFTQKALNHA